MDAVCSCGFDFWGRTEPAFFSISPSKMHVFVLQVKQVNFFFLPLPFAAIQVLKGCVAV